MACMPEPRLATFPAIRKALRWYQIGSIVTGVMLLLLVAEMVLKYSPLHVELFMGGSGGFLWFAESVPNAYCTWYSKAIPNIDECEMTATGDGFNLSLFILVAHGFLYVAYLFTAYQLWSKMRWNFLKFLQLALAGVVPFYSFVMEAQVTKKVKLYLDQREAEAAAKDAASGTDSSSNNTEATNPKGDAS